MTNFTLKNPHTAIEMDQPELDVLTDWELDLYDDAQEM